MKKLFHLAVILAFLLALLPAAGLAHTEDDPLVVDLLAGQTMDIGDVKIWNDADTLYVKLVYTGPDCGFLEVHLQVDEGDWDEEILTKKENPIPGQFEMSYKPGGCFTEHTFTFDLSDEGFEVNDDLMIAAHAALGLAESMTIVSDTSTAVTEVNSTIVTANAVLANEPVGYPNCATYAPDGTGSAWDSAVTIPGAHWIWNTLNPEHPIEGDVVTFSKTFNVPGMPNGGMLYITADNGYKATLNGVPLGSAQLGPGFPTTLKETTDTTPQAGNWGVASQGWQSVESYPLLELMPGVNTLVVTAANEYMWNTNDQYYGKDYYYGNYDPSGGSVNPDPFPGYGLGIDGICRNPGGLIFKATMDYYASGETAWGAGTRFTEDKNWATYFGYTVQGVEMPVEWPEGGTTTVAFEDLPLGGSLDYDYNDWVADIDTLATFWGTSTDRDLTKMDFTIIPEARGAGYNHIFHILIPANTFACGGTSTLTIYDGFGNQQSQVIATFDATNANDFVVIPNTTTALPGTLTNTIEPAGIVSHYPTINNTDVNAPQHEPYVPPQRTATLSIDFGEGCPFNFDAYNPYSGFHGEGLFFDPFLYVINTGNLIHTEDPRMLTVPADWMWPEAGVAVWLAYTTGVTSGDPPTFTTNWWLSYNDKVYDGKP